MPSEQFSAWKIVTVYDPKVLLIFVYLQAFPSEYPFTNTNLRQVPSITLIQNQ